MHTKRFKYNFKQNMKGIIIATISLYTLTAGAIGWSIHGSTPPLIIHEKSTNECQISTKLVATSTEPSPELKELSITLNKAEANLRECWYSYSKDCNMECVIPEVEECEDFSFERQAFLVEENSLQKTVSGCRENESKLLTDLKECRKMLPHF